MKTEKRNQIIKKNIPKSTLKYNKLKTKVGLDGSLAKCLFEKTKQYKKIELKENRFQIQL